MLLFYGCVLAVRFRWIHCSNSTVIYTAAEVVSAGHPWVISHLISGILRANLKQNEVVGMLQCSSWWTAGITIRNNRQLCHVSKASLHHLLCNKTRTSEQLNEHNTSNCNGRCPFLGIKMFVRCDMSSVYCAFIYRKLLSLESPKTVRHNIGDVGRLAKHPSLCDCVGKKLVRKSNENISFLWDALEIERAFRTLPVQISMGWFACLLVHLFIYSVAYHSSFLSPAPKNTFISINMN